jgi:hypothetical protein
MLPDVRLRKNKKARANSPEPLSFIFCNDISESPVDLPEERA